MAAKQTWNNKGHDYDMPDAIAGSLIFGSTWELFCRECGRNIYVNVVDMIERHGDRFTSDVLWHRARCRDCGERMKMAGGAFVRQLKPYGHFHQLVVSDGSSWRRPNFNRL